jgi:hypothetical protein
LNELVVESGQGAVKVGEIHGFSPAEKCACSSPVRGLDQTSLLGVALLSLATRTARADVEPVHILYEARGECPEPAAFIDQILLRTHRARLARTDEPGRTFLVTVVAGREEIEGRLVIRALDDTTTTREVTGRTCREVAAALALVTAVAIDPESSREMPPAPPPPSEALPPPSEPPAVVPAEPSRRGAPAPGAGSARWSWAAGAAGGVRGSVAPVPAAAAAIFGELSRVDRVRSGAPWALSALRLSANFARTGWLTSGPGEARFTWVALDLQACAFRLQVGASLQIQPCLSLEGGLLQGTGRIARAKTTTRPWIGVGPLLGVTLPLSRVWFLEAEGGVTLALERDTFIFEEPRSKVYRAPLVGGTAELGVGYRFGDQ